MSQFGTPDNEFLKAEYAKDKREIAESGELRPMKLEKGITELRILPPLPGKKAWYREYKEYIFETNEWNRITSPSQYGLPDPVAEKRQELVDAGGEANLAVAKDLREQRAFLYNVIIKSAPPGVDFQPGKVYVLKTGVKVKRALLNHDQDDQGGWADITNPENGVTFRISKSGSGFKTDYQVSPCANRTRLQDDLAAAGMAMIGPEHLYNLEELFPVIPEEDIRMRLIGITPRVETPNAPAQQTPQFTPVGQGATGTPVATGTPATADPVPADPTLKPQTVVQNPTAMPVDQGQATPVAGAHQTVSQAAPVQQTVAEPVEAAALPEVPAPPPTQADIDKGF